MEFTADEIQALIQQSPAWSLLDRITELTKGERASGYKLVAANDPLLGRNAAGALAVPPVVLLEALSQLAVVLVYASAPFEPRTTTAWCVGIEKAKLFRGACPGERVELGATIVRHRNNISKLRAVARVGNTPAVETDLILSVLERSALP